MLKVNEMEQEEAERILCDDGCCIGAIDERGFCNVCGKLKEKSRGMDETQGSDLSPVYPSSDTIQSTRGWDIDDIIAGILKGLFYTIVVLVVLGIILFLGITILMVGWKIIKWAWE
jgi:hypothetical protein